MDKPCQKQEIATSAGKFVFEPVELYPGRRVIDREQARINLLDFKRVMDEGGVGFGIIFGTLLGAVREGNFIAHDEDTDVFILDEDRAAFLALLFAFREQGFSVARYSGDMLSLIRNDDYIDVYMFKKRIGGKRVASELSLKAEFLDGYDIVEFLGQQFRTPKDHISFLEYSYGSDWRTPRKNAPAKVFTYYYQLKLILSAVVPHPVWRMGKWVKDAIKSMFTRCSQ